MELHSLRRAEGFTLFPHFCFFLFCSEIPLSKSPIARHTLSHSQAVWVSLSQFWRFFHPPHYHTVPKHTHAHMRTRTHAHTHTHTCTHTHTHMHKHTRTHRQTKIQDFNTFVENNAFKYRSAVHKEFRKKFITLKNYIF